MAVNGQAGFDGCSFIFSFSFAGEDEKPVRLTMADLQERWIAAQVGRLGLSSRPGGASTETAVWEPVNACI